MLPRSMSFALAALALTVFAGWYFLMRDDRPAQQTTPIETTTAEASPASLLAAGGGGRADASVETFANKIVGYWNSDGVACAAGPHVTLEGGRLVFTTPDGRLVHEILQQTSQEAVTKVIEPSSDAGQQYRLTPEYFATDALRSFNLIVQNRTTGTRDNWTPCTP